MHTGAQGREKFEGLCVDILEYLFVPPLTRVVSQSARLDRQDIRDAVLPNSASGYFWESIRREFDARHLVVEFKNYVGPVDKNDVIQLRQYVGRKFLGRFGVLISRFQPTKSALTARANAYEEQNVLILFLDDDTIRRLIDVRRHGSDPAVILQEMKEAFEIAY